MPLHLGLLPIGRHRLPHLRQIRQLAWGHSRHPHQVHAVGGSEGPHPGAQGLLEQRIGEGRAELGHQLLAAFLAPARTRHRQGVAKAGWIRNRPRAVQGCFQGCSIAVQLSTATGRVEKHLLKAHARITAEALGMGVEVALQLLVAG